MSQPTQFKIVPCVFFLLAWFASIGNTFAQSSSTSENNITSLLPVIMMLLEEDDEVALKAGEFDDTLRSVSKSLKVSVEPTAEETEVCFHLSSSSPINESTIAIEINRELQTGANSASSGENCYVLPPNIGTEPIVLLVSVVEGVTATIRDIGVSTSEPTWLGLPIVSRSSWDERAVRKVLKIFAYGGQATDQQIKTWSNMRPILAVEEMLNFSPHNPKLSPLTTDEKYVEPRDSHGTLREFYQHMGSVDSNIPVDVDERRHLGIDGYRFATTFGRMVTMRGLNPFRQKIGFWETNYHLATNRNAGVSREQMVEYYDSIMEAHENRVPYHEVMGVAAKSAAVAMQYGHRRNQWVQRWVNGERIYVLEGNDDFAREIHQLFFGIFGVDDPNHEDITIGNTAKMLTDMRVPYIDDFGFANHVTFETDQHHRDEFGPLQILGRDITGFDAAEKIDNLMPISISHPESLSNLPVYIISTLADDSMTNAKRELVRNAWAALGDNKDFLTFIRAYALSDMFHSPEHIKYFSSFDRAYYIANKFNIDNIEAYIGNDYNGGRAGKEIENVFDGDNASEAFEPLHNVFGGQTSLEASDSSVAFEKNYNRSATQESWMFYNEYPVDCESCDQGLGWTKDWTKVIPSSNGTYLVEDVARWLWLHIVGNLDNYTALERAHLVSILGAKRLPDDEGTERWWELDDRYPIFDLNSLLCIHEDRLEQGESSSSLSDLMAYESWRNYCRVSDESYSSTELAALNLSFNGNDLENSTAAPFPYLRGIVEELAQEQLNLNDEDEIQKRRANERVQAALAFIFATPFVFAEGR